MRLIKGIAQFREGSLPELTGLFHKLSQGQNPEALFITCSDSRIDPNLLTKSQPGDLFIMRNAGNIVPAYWAGRGGEAATIEYAVSVLGVQHVVVCGHSRCGVIDAIVHPERAEKLPAVKAWLEQAETTRRIMRENYSDLLGDELIDAVTQEHVLAQIEMLQTHPSVAARLVKGDLKLHGWVYKIESGEVVGYDLQHQQFVPIEKYEASAGGSALKLRTQLIV